MSIHLALNLLSTHCDSNDLRMDNEREEKNGKTEKNSVVLRDEDRKTKKWTE